VALLEFFTRAAVTHLVAANLWGSSHKRSLRRVVVMMVMRWVGAGLFALVVYMHVAVVVLLIVLFSVVVVVVFMIVVCHWFPCLWNESL
jgi:hypothetical protein